jgi:hypothetical protein
MPGAAETAPGNLHPAAGGTSMRRGLTIELYESGAHTLRLDAPIEIYRCALSTIPSFAKVPANSPVTIGPGDVMVSSGRAATGRFDSRGADAVVTVAVAIESDAESYTSSFLSLPGLVTELSRAIPSDLERLGYDSITVSLSLVALPPGTAMPPYEPAGLQAIDIRAGRVGVAFILPGEDASSRPATVYRAGQTAPFLPLNPGTKICLANDGAQPAEMLTVLC